MGFADFAVVRIGNIAMFDYDDEEKNMEHYEQPSPPEYDMKNIPKELLFSSVLEGRILFLI